MKKNVITRPYMHKELAALYQVSWMTLRRWLRPFEPELGKKIGHYYNVKQVTIIFARLGLPEAKTGGG